LTRRKGVILFGAGCRCASLSIVKGKEKDIILMSGTSYNSAKSWGRGGVGEGLPYNRFQQGSKKTRFASS